MDKETSDQHMTDFLHMQGYGIYVWPAYTISAIFLAWLAFRSQRQLKRAKQQYLTDKAN